jgi:hypothetical protein
MSDKASVISLVLSIAMVIACGGALYEMKRLDAKVTALEAAPADPKALPDGAKPAADDPRGVLASRIEALERRLEQSDADHAFSLRAFKEEAERAAAEIDADAAEIMGKLAEIRKNPPAELTDAILEDRVRAGLLEKRKKDLKKLVKKEGLKQLKNAGEKMNLTAEQMEELKKFMEQLYTEWSDTLGRIFSGEEIPPAELDAKVNDTKARVDTKMKEVLKPEQYETWKKEVEPGFYQDPFRGMTR